MSDRPAEKRSLARPALRAVPAFGDTKLGDTSRLVRKFLEPLDLPAEQRYLAWNADVNGSERFTLNLTDLDGGRVLAEPIPDTLASPVWTADSTQLLYVVVNEQWRPYQVRLHTIGTSPGDDWIVYEETDEAFFVNIDKTSSEAFLLITTGDHVTSEVRCLPAYDPKAEPRLFSQRRPGHEYSVDHGEGWF